MCVTLSRRSMLVVLLKPVSPFTGDHTCHSFKAGRHISFCLLTSNASVASKYRTVHVFHTKVSSALQVPCLNRIFCPVHRLQLTCVKQSHFLWLTISELQPLALSRAWPASWMQALYLAFAASFSVSNSSLFCLPNFKGQTCGLCSLLKAPVPWLSFSSVPVSLKGYFPRLTSPTFFSGWPMKDETLSFPPPNAIFTSHVFVSRQTSVQGIYCLLERANPEAISSSFYPHNKPWYSNYLLVCRGIQNL